MKKLLCPLLALLFMSFSKTASAFEATAFYFSDTIVYQTFSICEGDSVVVGNSVYTETGVYQDVFLSSQMDDSIVITTVARLSAQDLLPPTIRVCSEEEILLQITPTALQTEFTNNSDMPVRDGFSPPTEIPIFVNYFLPGREIQSLQDIGRICLNIEHSWMHDLDIFLTCPSGQSIILQDQEFIGSGIFLGDPYELDDFNTPDPPIPGIGWNYCWTSEATQTFNEYSIANPNADILPEGDYLPSESFDNLIGCPLNGEWTIGVRDQWAQDNGWVFGASIDFNIHEELPVDILWSTGETTPSVTVSQTSLYSVAITTSSSCILTDTVAVSVQPAQIVAFSNGLQFLALPAGASYRWYKNGVLIPGAIGQVLLHNGEAGVYSVLVMLHGQECQSLPYQIFDYQPQQTRSDCAAAIPLCSSISVNGTSLPGAGTDDFSDPDNQPGCLIGGEQTAAWYRFSFASDMPAGSLFEMEIIPVEDSVNFDFAIYGPHLNCDSLGAPIRCSYAAPLCAQCTATGLNGVASDTTEDALGDGILAPIEVQPGQSYYLLLNTQAGNHGGFELSVGGAASAYLACPEDFCPIWVETNDMAVCGGASIQLDSIALSASQHATFEWVAQDPGNMFLDDISLLTPTISPPVEFSGDLYYSLVVSDGNCAVAEAVKVTVQASPSAYISGELVYCNFAGTTLRAGENLVAGQEYLWSTGSTIFKTLVSEPGLYSVFVRNEAGCELRDTVEVFKLSPEIEYVVGSNYLTSLTLFPGATYQWHLNGQPVEGANEAIFNFTEGGTYRLEVSLMDISCFSEPLIITGTNDAQPDFLWLKGFPNPTTGQINIESSYPMERLLILNAYGQQLREVQGAGQTRLPLDFSGYPSGVYWVMVRMENKVQTLKVGVVR